MSTTFNALAFNITALRELGILKRVRGTPLPTSAYLAGIAGSAITNTALQIVIITATGHLVFGLDWPQDWPSLAIFVVVGVICFASLGVALSHVIPNLDSGARVRQRGVPADDLHLRRLLRRGRRAALISDAAQALPLKHLIDGLQGAMITGEGVGRTRSRSSSSAPGPSPASRSRYAASRGSRARASRGSADVDDEVGAAAAAGEALDADPGDAAAAEHDRAVRRAVQPGAHGRARRRERAAAPGDDLADVRRATRPRGRARRGSCRSARRGRSSDGAPCRRRGGRRRGRGGARRRTRSGRSGRAAG